MVGGTRLGILVGWWTLWVRFSLSRFEWMDGSDGGLIVVGSVAPAVVAAVNGEGEGSVFAVDHFTYL